MRRPTLLLALLLAVAGVLGPPAAGFAPPVRAAETDLTLVTSARYVVDPASARVRVTVDIIARNARADTTTRRFYFDHGFLAVLPGATGFAVTGDTKPTVAVARRTADYTLLRINFGQRIYGGTQAAYRLTFDLPDPGSPPERDVRVGDSLVTFPIWAFASDGATGSTVSVTFPAGYEVTFESGTFPEPTIADDGSLVFSSGRLAAPLDFFAFAVGEREGSTADVALSIPIGDDAADVTLRAWADDPAWAERVRSLLADGVPMLADEIGLAWPWDEPLVVEESISRASGGYAGVFDPAERRIEVAYWASPGVVIHEAAHVWFNGALLADRWASEGFASLYAGRVATELALSPDTVALTEELLEQRVPLNAWGPIADDADLEAFGYAASLQLASLVAERAGDEAMRQVWVWAADGTAAYHDPARPDAPLPTTDGPPDWRGLLDLLDEAAGSSFSDLWRAWVVREDDAALLDARVAARSSLSRTEALADGWALPPLAREALRAWQFETAEQALADARTVLAQRQAVDAAAARAGLELPDTLRDLFEAGDLPAASALASTQFSAIEVLDGAAAYRPVNPDPLTAIGLLGEDPDAALAEARLALAAGDTETALADALQAQSVWTGAWEEGRRRALLGVAVLAALALLVSAVAGRLRHSRAAMTAAVTAGAVGGVAAPPDPATDGAAGAEPHTGGTTAPDDPDDATRPPA